MIELHKIKLLNGWNLFWLVSAPVSVAMLFAMAYTDLSSGEGISSLIQLSVRFAVPLLYLTFAASAVQTLFRNDVGRWLFRNRKYLGLSFAAAMAWQALFILWMVTVYREYYVEEVYVLRDAIEGVVGYLFLIAMVITSFRVTRSRMKPGTWRLLHLSGIYFLWAYAFSVYWWALFYYASPQVVDYVFYWGGFLAWALRVAAWNRKRLLQGVPNPDVAAPQPVLNLLGIAVIAAGSIAAAFGSAWYETADQWLSGYALTRIPETYLPYWPFEPWLPLAVIGLGSFLVANARLRARNEV